MAYKYKTQAFLEQGVDFAAIDADKQKAGAGQMNLAFSLPEIVEFIKKQSEDFSRQDQHLMDMDAAITKIVAQYQKVTQAPKMKEAKGLQPKPAYEAKVNKSLAVIATPKKVGEDEPVEEPVTPVVEPTGEVPLEPVVQPIVVVPPVVTPIEPAATSAEGEVTQQDLSDQIEMLELLLESDSENEDLKDTISSLKDLYEMQYGEPFKLAEGGAHTKEVDDADKKTEEAIKKIIARLDEYKTADKEDKKIFTHERIKKLVLAGYSGDEIVTIALGYGANHKILCDGELSGSVNRPSGLTSIRAESLDGEIDAYVSVAKNKTYELGLKYPEFNWKKIFNKYKISTTPTTFIHEKESGHKYEYAAFVGENVVLGYTLKYTDTNGNETKSTESEKLNLNDKINFKNVGYMGIVSSKKQTIEDIAELLVSQKNGYVKDLDIYVNGMGGIGAFNLEGTSIKFEDGGDVIDFSRPQIGAIQSVRLVTGDSYAPSAFEMGGSIEVKKSNIEIVGIDRSELSERDWDDIFSFCNHGYKKGELILKDNKGKDTSKSFKWEIKSGINEGIIPDEKVNEVLKHYMIAALWSSNDYDAEGEPPFDANYSIEDIDPATGESMRMDVVKFLTENKEALEKSELPDSQIGHDFWLSRNGHGAGFFDRSLDADVEKKLMDSAKAFKECNLYADNGKVKVDPINKLVKTDKPASTGFNAHTDEWFDELVEYIQTEKEIDPNYHKLVELAHKEATKANLKKFEEIMKSCSCSKPELKAKILSNINKVLDNEYKKEFKFQFGGKAKKSGKVSAASSFFDLFLQAVQYNSDTTTMEKGGGVKRLTKKELRDYNEDYRGREQEKPLRNYDGSDAEGGRVKEQARKDTIQLLFENYGFKQKKKAYDAIQYHNAAKDVYAMYDMKLNTVEIGEDKLQLSVKAIKKYLDDKGYVSANPKAFAIIDTHKN